MSSSWRDAVLREFIPQISRLTLVADPDGLLLDEGVIEGVRSRGFDVIEFSDHVAFRFAYESKYRAAWDRNEATDLVVVLRSSLADLGSLPFDLLQAGRQLAFSLGDLFPNLCTWVVAALDRADLDKLWAAQEQFAPGSLGENATKDFVLRHVFEVAPELITKPSDLLRVLLRRHYSRMEIPPIFDERLIGLLRHSGRFQGWPLDKIVSDGAAFFRFLQERWPAFLKRLEATGDGVDEPQAGFGFEFDGPAILPFDHDDVRVYMPNLFAEDILRPVEGPANGRLSAHWAAVGVVSDPLKDAGRRLDALVGAVRETLPGASARYQEWLAFGHRWAQLRLAQYEAPVEVATARLETLRESATGVEERFTAWVLGRFAGLYNQPARPPVMVHHISRVLAYNREVSGAKVALVVVDGLALDQWLVLRSSLLARDAGLFFTDGAVFAWLPTLTSVSRQAIFAGRAPLYFPTSILTTEKEPQAWAQFWADQGLAAQNVGYLKALGDSSSLGAVHEMIGRPGIKALGLVVDTVDKIMHGMELGSRGMHGQVRQWAEQGFFGDLLSLLLGQGFHVYLTSDHGNVEALGCGRPREGALADVRGERARIYPNQSLCDMVAADFPGSIRWPGFGLPPGCHALFAPTGGAFVTPGERVVAHGSFSIEELIVPFIKVERAGA
jgi:hypothetical protein